MKQLIVNADDFGYTRGVNSGVIRCFRQGIVTSATIMANGPAFEDAVEHAKQNPNLGVGCHLALLDGCSVEAPNVIPSFADREGRLPRTLASLIGRVTTGSIRGQDIAREIRAQITKVLDAGIRPTHIDTHKHAHAHPRIFELVIQVAGEFGIRRVRRPFEDASVSLISAFRDGWGSMKQSALALAARTASRQFEKVSRARDILSPDRLWGIAATGHMNRDEVLAAIRSMPDGVSELMCHPGEYDNELEHSATRLKRARETELKALTDPIVRTAIEAHKIKLIDYRDLR